MILTFQRCWRLNDVHCWLWAGTVFSKGAIEPLLETRIPLLQTLKIVAYLLVHCLGQGSGPLIVLDSEMCIYVTEIKRQHQLLIATILIRSTRTFIDVCEVEATCCVDFGLRSPLWINSEYVIGELTCTLRGSSLVRPGCSYRLGSLHFLDINSLGLLLFLWGLLLLSWLKLLSSD